MPLNTLVISGCKTLRSAVIRNAPTILTVLAGVGLAYTSYLVATEAPKAKEEYDKLKERELDCSVKDIVTVSGKHYIPAIFVGSMTLGCIIGANVINKQQQASLATAFAGLHTYYNAYRNEVIEKFGEEADDDIRASIARLNPEFHQIGMDSPDLKLTFIDDYGNSVTCYERELMDAEYHFNRNYVLGGCGSLKQFYDMAGIKYSDPKHYRDIGWSSSSGISWVDFVHYPDKYDPSIYHLSYIWTPTEEDLYDWCCL